MEKSNKNDELQQIFNEKGETLSPVLPDNVKNYQTDLDNFKLAIEELDNNFVEAIGANKFKIEFEGRISDIIFQQLKEQVLLNVLERRLKDLL